MGFVSVLGGRAVRVLSTGLERGLKRTQRALLPPTSPCQQGRRVYIPFGGLLCGRVVRML